MNKTVTIVEWSKAFRWKKLVRFKVLESDYLWRIWSGGRKRRQFFSRLRSRNIFGSSISVGSLWLVKMQGKIWFANGRRMRVKKSAISWKIQSFMDFVKRLKVWRIAFVRRNFRIGFRLRVMIKLIYVYGFVLFLGKHNWCIIFVVTEWVHIWKISCSSEVSMEYIDQFEPCLMYQKL